MRYVSYSWTGDVMSDGVPCPSLHDGMAVVWATQLALNSQDDASDKPSAQQSLPRRTANARRHSCSSAITSRLSAHRI